MFRIIAVMCFIALSGCSVGMTNKGSPIKLNGCDHVWPPIVDFGASVGMTVGTAILADQNVVPAGDEAAYITGGLFIAGAFAMSALMGAGEKYSCPE